MKLKTKIGIGILFYFAIAFIFTGLSETKYLPIAIVGIVLGYFTFKLMRRKQAEAEEEEQLELERQLAQETKPEPPKPSEPKFTIRYETMSGKVKEIGNKPSRAYSIKGINHANLDDSYLGEHDGYIQAITDNEHDPYAVAVYVGEKRVGWLPRGNSRIHGELLEIGGTLDVRIIISKAYDEDDGHPFYHGKVFVQRLQKNG